MGTSKGSRSKRLVIIRNTIAATAALLTAACGGGGEVSSPSTSSAPSTPPAPAPAPSPSLTSSAATVGYHASVAAVSAKAALVPVAYDLMTGTLVEERRTFDLSPTAGEVDLELGWSTALASSSTLLGRVARAFDAGHVRGASDIAAFFNLVVR